MPSHPSPTQTIISTQEPQNTLTVVGEEIYFLLDTEATISVLLSNPCLPWSHSVTIKGVSGKLVTRHFSQPLSYNWVIFFFSQTFLIMPESQTPLLGPDILVLLRTTIRMKTEQEHCLPLVKTEVDPEVWVTQGNIERDQGKLDWNILCLGK